MMHVVNICRLEDFHIMDLFRLGAHMGGAVFYTHMHTHTYIYIYIYIRASSGCASPCFFYEVVGLSDCCSLVSPRRRHTFVTTHGYVVCFYVPFPYSCVLFK